MVESGAHRSSGQPPRETWRMEKYNRDIERERKSGWASEEKEEKGEERGDGRRGDWEDVEWP